MIARLQVRTGLQLALLLVWIVVTGSLSSAGAQQATLVRLSGNVPSAGALATFQSFGRLDGTTPIPLVLTLPLRNQADLTTHLQRIYNPADSLYGHYLTPQQFAAQYGPTQADYDAVTAFAQAQGLTVTGTHPEHTMLDVSAPASVVESAFGIHMMSYKMPNDRNGLGGNDPLVLDRLFPNCRMIDHVQFQ